MTKEKIPFYMFVLIVLFFIGVAITIRTISYEIDKKIELIKSEATDVIEGIRCEFTYKDLQYKGICTEELLDSMQDLVEYDRHLELLKSCMNQPYAYRWELCEELKN